MSPNMAPRLTPQVSTSMSLMRAETIPVGSEVWVDDEKQVWMLVKVVRQDNTILTVRQKTTGDEEEVDLAFGEMHPTNPKVVSDMTSLHHIHEAGILHNLGERAKLRNQRPYTFMGTILIALNPLRRVPNPDMSEYMDCSLNPEAPHPYAIAELAYYQMRLGAGRKTANQSIVVSGESGAGKTETSKIILTFLTHRSVGGVDGLEQKVVDTSPILEAFGNAKTLRNNNSSRFGKFLKLQFTKKKYKLAGAFVETYLLEKSRVLAQGLGERNFHILYQLIAGGESSGLGEKLKLEDVESYKILSQSECTTLDDVDDEEEFQGVKAAFDTIGIEEEAQVQVWQMLASVLHLSELEFDEVDHEQGDIAFISDREVLSTLSMLLGVEEPKLESMLTQKVVVTRGEVFIKQRGMQDANLTRDAIVKSLYESLFLWVVSVVNTSLGKGPDNLPFIGVLDIFGFENFDTKNEFEQLLINFTNESLQDTFNRQVFNNEIKLYADEGIEVVVSPCPDNSECLKMLSARPIGIIPSLDNVCEEPNPSDSRYLAGVHKAHAKHADFPRTPPKDMRECFTVKHYAGKVKYTVQGWVGRNMDRIPESFRDTLQSSTHKVVKEATTKYGQVPGTAKAKPSRKTLVKPTVGKAFLGSMRDLNVTLLSTMCNFVRCIKPNAAMECGVYDNRYVVDQLQCLGILQTCEVLKVGMPTRVTYSELKEVLGDKATEAEKLFEKEPETALIASILWAFEVPSGAFRLGRTRVFFRAGQISTLQKILNETSPEKGPWIYGRLQEALANRHKAKAAAEEAQAAVADTVKVVNDAQHEAAKVLGAEEDDEYGTPNRPPPKPVMNSDEKYKLESAVKKARKAGSCTSQVKTFIEAAKDEGLGTYAEGLMDRVMSASEMVLETLKASSSMADDMSAAITMAKGGDTAGDMRRLEDALKRLRDIFQEANQLATGSQEAAAKCQVEKTEDLREQSKQKAEVVTTQASAVMNVAKGIAEAANQQVDALARAKDMLPSAAAATEEALAALSSFRTVVSEASDEEAEAKRISDAKAEAEAEARRQAALEKARKEAEEAAARKAEQEAEKAQEAAARKKKEADEAAAVEEAKKKAAEAARLEKEEEEDGMSSLPPSEAPKLGHHQSLMKKTISRSIKDILAATSPPDMSVSPNAKEKDDARFNSSAGLGRPMAGGGQRSFKTVFKETTEKGPMQGHLLMHSQQHASMWRPRYFRLEDNFLTYYVNKSLVGTPNNENMELTAHSITKFINHPRFGFSVTTGEVIWLLVARSEAVMDKWMAAINAQIHENFVNKYNIPADNYRSQGLQGQSFYRMVDDVAPRWILAYPMEQAPRTGEGLFPGDVIEVTQVLSHEGKVFLRIANDRGWTYADSPEDGSVLFDKVASEISEDNRTYVVPTEEPIPIMYGPGLESQPTNAELFLGDRIEGKQIFTPLAEWGVSFLKLADDSGWVPLHGKNYSFGVVLAET